jgi:hypothetical protein
MKTLQSVLTARLLDMYTNLKPCVGNELEVHQVLGKHQQTCLSTSQGWA